MTNYSKLLDLITETGEAPKETMHSRVLVIDALNLFFRNFATMNIVNPDGVHIGGMAGFIRSVGTLIKTIEPTGVYVIFDGVGSSSNRKNVLSEYKSNRGLTRITNWDAFEDLEEENDAKISQITRLINYLQCLPIKVGMINKAEADDAIAYLAQQLPKLHKSHVTIVSSDKDYMQLVSKNITLYRPTEKKFYDQQAIMQEVGVLPENFIIVKCLTGDASDAIPGIKGLGTKTILKLFPELSHKFIPLANILDICEERLGKNKGFARIISEWARVEKNYKVMNLSDPMLDDSQKAYLDDLINQPHNGFYKEAFLHMYEVDKIGGFIRNIEYYLENTYNKLNEYK